MVVTAASIPDPAGARQLLQRFGGFCNNLRKIWGDEAVFQMMMLAYNLFLLFKFDSLSISEYRQQIKTFRLKYMFLAAKIIRTASYVVMKLSAKYQHKDVYERCLS